VEVLLFVSAVIAAGYFISRIDHSVWKRRSSSKCSAQEIDNLGNEEDRQAIELEMIKRRNRERENQIIAERESRRVRRGPRGGRYTMARTRDGRPYRKYF
jgi:hypothetical protein